MIPDVPGFGESSQVPTDRYDVESQVGRIARFMGHSPTLERPDETAKVYTGFMKEKK